MGPKIVENVNLFPYLNDLECRENQKQETRLRHQQQQLLNTMLTFGNSLKINLEGQGPNFGTLVGAVIDKRSKSPIVKRLI